MMKNNTSPMVFFCYQRETILKSQHEPFLSGNIAPRDVIKIISRKAISSLVDSLTSIDQRSLSVSVRNAKRHFSKTEPTYRLNSVIPVIHTGNPVVESIYR